MSIPLNDLIILYLANAGISPPPDGSYQVEFVVADGHNEITFWDTAALGAQPSDATLQALQTTADTIATAPTDYAEKLVLGIDVTSTGTPALSATYGIDGQSQQQLKDIVGFFVDCGILPSGGPTFPYPDMSGLPHDFSGAQLIQLLKATGPLVYQLQVVLAQRLQGVAAAWPSQAATIP